MHKYQYSLLSLKKKKKHQKLTFIHCHIYKPERLPFLNLSARSPGFQGYHPIKKHFLNDKAVGTLLECEPHPQLPNYIWGMSNPRLKQPFFFQILFFYYLEVDNSLDIHHTQRFQPWFDFFLPFVFIITSFIVYHPLKQILLYFCLI